MKNFLVFILMSKIFTMEENIQLDILNIVANLGMH